MQATMEERFDVRADAIFDNQINRPPLHTPERTGRSARMTEGRWRQVVLLSLVCASLTEGIAATSIAAAAAYHALGTLQPLAAVAGYGAPQGLGGVIPRTPYDDIIEEGTALCGNPVLTPDLVKSVMKTESNFNPQAVSSKGAMGLMQLMPRTARLFGVIDPFDPRENTRGGIAFLCVLLQRFGNNLELALAAYNAGPDDPAVRAGSIPQNGETPVFVAKVLGCYRGELPFEGPEGAPVVAEPVIYHRSVIIH